MELVLQPIEADATTAIGAGRHECTQSRDGPQRAQRPLVGHPGRDVGLRDPQAAKGELLSVGAQAALAHRPTCANARSENVTPGP